MEVTQYSSRHCPGCKEMKPELEKLKKEGIKVNIINCDKGGSKCKDIQHVPTIILKKGRKSRKITRYATAEEIKKKFKSL